MIFYLFAAVLASTALVLGASFGIYAGLAAAKDVPGAYLKGAKRVLIAHVILAMVAFVAFRFFEAQSSVTIPYTFENMRQWWRSAVMFLIASAILWVPIYSGVFGITRGIAR